MNTRLLSLLTMVALMALLACSGESKDLPTDLSVDLENDLPTPADVTGDTVAPPADILEEVASGPFPLPELTEPVPFRAALAGG